MSDDPQEKPTGKPSVAVDPPDADAPPAQSAGAESAEMVSVRQQKDELYDRLLRKTAEFDNYRKRVERERREQADRTVEALLLDLLPVVDDFERALEVETGPEAEAYRKGVELIHAKLRDLLQKRNVTPIDALGADFDPNVHQAVTYEANEGRRDGEVIDVLQRGYMHGDRLLRPAMVKVAKRE